MSNSTFQNRLYQVEIMSPRWKTAGKFLIRGSTRVCRKVHGWWMSFFKQKKNNIYYCIISHARGEVEWYLIGYWKFHLVVPSAQDLSLLQVAVLLRLCSIHSAVSPFSSSHYLFFPSLPEIRNKKLIKIRHILEYSNLFNIQILFIIFTDKVSFFNIGVELAMKCV